jgi:methylmalonyl-CoA mutase C-terminal domain/subunit
LIRVLLAKPGIDGHDVGVKVVARALRDAGMEVIYSGLRTTIPETIRIAVQEDVDVIGVSNLSGQHVTMMGQLRRGLAEAGLDDVLVVAGGTLLKEDIVALRELGIQGCFPPGSDTGEIIEFIRKHVPVRNGAASGAGA